MARTTDQRVDAALSSLLDHLIPVHHDEDDESAEQRLDDAYEYTRQVLGSANGSDIAVDVHHAADLIKRKLIRDNNTPEKALQFSTLYSRLLSKPVLEQKWAILYFIYLLADSPEANPHQEPRPSALASNHMPVYRAAVEADEQPESTPKSRPDRQFHVDSPAFNATFSSQGLPRLSEAEESLKPRSETPILRQKRERPKDEKPIATDTEAGAAAAAAPQICVKLDSPIPAEPNLLRDLPFTLLGLSSINFRFSSNQTLEFPETLPVPIISLLHALAEPSLLYKRLSEFVETDDGGLLGQSFRSALGIELRAYLGLVASLEGQIRRALAQLDQSNPRQGLGRAGVTLKRCVVWTREATMGLRLMSLMVEKSKDRKGGQLISIIHSYSLTHGDPFVQSFAERLLSHVTCPFYDMLRQWIYDGELSDPHLEFFVSERHESLNESDMNGRKGHVRSVWDEKYKLTSAMVPSIITDSFAHKVFLIGKSLNFIRHDCRDSGWVESYSLSASRELRYGDTATLETSIDEAYKTTMARLIHLMAIKFHLFDHLTALKKYLLLGAGDFIAVLMESLSANLDRPANTQYRHTLTAQLEHAVRNSNSQFDPPDVLRRLDSRMLELSHGEIGWDVFTLEYKISAPIDVIVTPFGSKQYLKVFNFLWRVKRVEFALGSTWRRCTTGSRVVLSNVQDKVGRDWKTARCVIAEMVHFISQLQYYILFEVIEASWNELQKTMHKPESTLDDLIEAHAAYLNSITRKGLLGSNTIDFTSQLHELLKTMLAYKDAVDGLYSFSAAEFTKRQELSAKIENRTADGKWGTSERDDDFSSSRPTSAVPSNPFQSNNLSEASPVFPLPAGLTPASSEDEILNRLRDRLTTLAGEFKARLNVLLGDLMHQPDLDLRWLGMVMNFNDVYQPVRRKKKVAGVKMPQTVEKGREKERV